MPDDLLSGREAIEKAFAEVQVDEAEAPARDRDEMGRFRAKEEAAVEAPVEAPTAPEAPVIEPQPDDLPPARWSTEARGLWASLPPSVRSETSRAFREMEAGIEKYRTEAEPLKRFADMAAAGGTTLVEALDRYTGIEQMLTANPLQGLDAICRNFGTDLRSVAAQVMGRPAPQRDAEVEQMRAQMNAMAQELQGYRSERQRTVGETVSKFAADHPRFDELSGAIADILDKKFMGITSLDAAYAMADRLNPSAMAAHTGPTPAPEPQKPAGPISIKGAPSSGSNPGGQAVLSARDAVAQAFATLR